MKERTRVEIETEIVARVKKEMDEPRLTESLRNGFAAPAAPWASHGNVKDPLLLNDICRRLAACPKSLLGLRDRPLILVGFAEHFAAQNSAR
jgi:hypothetical protein